MSSRKTIKLSSTPKTKKLLEDDEQVAVINPLTNRPVKVGGRVWRQLQRKEMNLGKGTPGRKKGSYNKVDTYKPEDTSSDEILNNRIDMILKDSYEMKKPKSMTKKVVISAAASKSRERGTSKVFDKKKVPYSKKVNIQLSEDSSSDEYTYETDTDTDSSN